MRLVCYLGTRGCPGVLEEALRDDFDPIAVLVPVEERLLGPHLDGSDAREGLRCVAELLASRARERGLRAAARTEEPLAGVFDERPEVEDRIHAGVIEPPIEEALVDAAREHGAETCYLARDALDVLDEAGIRPGERLQSAGVDLVTR